MCGIAGLLKLDGSRADRTELERMAATLRHRGPDAHGIETLGPVGFGHARLSIIDLQSGEQPMGNADGTLWITFNGEIFNYIELKEALVRKGHRFLTRSDTEVILNAYREYGEDCVEHFNGQWAFAIWDKRQQKLFLSRDRAGIRPLFYTETPDTFAFASEIKALLARSEATAEIDLRGLDQVFTFWSAVPPRTTFKNISQLPPGHSLSVLDGRVRTKQYWSLPFVPSDGIAEATERRAGEELLDLLFDATRIRLRSDVPVGAYLSGGIDSTITTAITKTIAKDQLRSFSITFKDAEFDESSYQREASAFIGTEHSSVSCSLADIARIFPDVIWHAEQPILRTAPAPMYLLSQLVEESGFKVVLTGEGADEVLGGYDIFKEAKIRRFWGRQLESRWRPLLLKRMYPYLKDIQRQPPSYLQHFFRVTAEDLASPFFSHLPRWELTSRLKSFFSSDVRGEVEKYDAVGDLASALPPDFGSWPHFSQGQYLETVYFLAGYLLSSQGDRMAMAHSVEGRYPFLDYRIIEFAAKLPPNLKMKVLNEKYLLKRACQGLVPPSILARVKQPYRAPDGESFFGPMAPDYVEELLSAEAIGKHGIFDANAVRMLVSKFQTGRASSVKDNMALVGILSTELLIHQFAHREQRMPCRCKPQTSNVKSTVLS